MNIIKRIGITFGSYVEELSKTLENPEEIVKATIEEIDRNLGKAELKLRKMSKEGSELKTKINLLTKERLEWENRAKREAGQNKDKALDCLERRNQCKEQTDFLEKMLNEHLELEANLKEEISTVKNKREKLRSKLTFLSTKDASSKAVNSIEGILKNQDNYLDEVLDRWELEIDLRSDNTKYQTSKTTDPLKAEYEMKEKQESLEKELEELIK